MLVTDEIAKHMYVYANTTDAQIEISFSDDFGNKFGDDIEMKDVFRYLNEIKKDMYQEFYDVSKWIESDEVGKVSIYDFVQQIKTLNEKRSK